MEERLIAIVHDLRAAQGRNNKIKILEQHKDNELWKTFLIYTYDEKISYGVSAPKTYDFHKATIDMSMFNSLDQLIRREITGKRAKQLSLSLSEHYGEIPRLVLGRSLKAGVSLTTINQVYDNLIDVFISMKGKDTPIVQYPVVSSVKYDGCKVFARVDHNGVTFMTSSGTPFTCESLYNEMKHATYGMYEGELVHRLGRQEDRAAITGALNSLLAKTKNTITIEHKYMIYDFISLKDWDNRESTLSFEDRQMSLQSAYNMSIGDSSIIYLVNHWLHTKEKQVKSFFNELVDQGYEGSMHRYLSDKYLFTGDKRTDRLIKKKALQECVLVCYDVQPHSNPLKGNIGSLFCKGEIDDKDYGRIEVNTKVGSGMSKFDIMKEPDDFLGEKIEIRYNVATKTEYGYSLFLPRFKRICTEKI